MLRLKIFALLKEAEKLLVSVTAIVSIAVLLTVPFVTSAAASLPSGSLDISAVVGDGTAGTVTNGASATGAVLEQPNGVWVGSSGSIYVTDAQAATLDYIPATTGTHYGQSMTAGDIYVIAGDPSGTQPADGLSPTSIKFSSVNDVIVDGSGNIYMADANDDVIGFIPASNGTYYGQSMTAGDFYVVAGTVTATGSPTVNTLATSTDLNFPDAIALGSNGLYITGNDEEVNFVPFASGTYYGQSMTANYIYKLAGTAATAGNPTSGTAATSTDLNGPDGVAVDSNGDVYIGDRYASEINFIPVTSGTYYGTSMTAEDIYTLSSSVNNPAEVAVDSAGDVFIANMGANEIDLIPVASGTYYGQSMTADSLYVIAGDGTAGLSGNGSVSTSAELNSPTGIFVTSNGSFYIGDTSNHEVRVVAPPPTITSVASATFTYDTAGSFNITTTGVPANSISESGTLPTGLSLTNNGNDTATLSGTPSEAGTFDITITASDSNGSANQSFTLTVNQASQTISFTSTAPSETYGSTTSYTPTATATSTLGVTFSIDSSSTAGTCSISGGVVSFSSGGTCIIDANQAGNADYSVAPQVQQLVTINKEPQTIVFTSSPSSTAVVGGAGYTPTATATSALGAAFTIDSTSTSGTCSITSGAVLFLKPGTCIIDANQAGNSDYLAAPQVQQSFGVVDGTSPGAPTDINATKGSDALNFTWSPPAENGGLAISSYLISLKNVTSNTASSALQDYTTSYDATSLIPGDVYQMSVSAVNSAGTSPTALSDNYVAVSLGASSGATWSGVATSPNQSITVGSAASGNSSISVTASGGTGSVSVTKYSGSPLPQLPDIPGSTFFSTSLSSQENFSNVTVEICGIPSGGSIGWWDQNTHVLETPTDVTSLGNGCYDVTVNSSTIPDVSELVDGIFMGVPADGAALFGSSGTSYSGTGGSGALASKVIVSKSVSLLGQGAKLGVTMECQGISTCAGNVTVFAVGRVKNRMKKVEAARGAFKLLAGKQRTVYYKTTKLGKSIFFYDLKHHIKIKPSQFIVTMIKSEADQVSFYYPHLNMAPRFLISKTKKKTLTLRVGCEAKFSCSEKVLLWQAVKVAGKEKFVLFAHGYSRLGSGQEKDITLYVTKSGMTAMSLIRKEKEKKTTLILGLVGSIRIHEGALLIFR